MVEQRTHTLSEEEMNQIKEYVEGLISQSFIKLLAYLGIPIVVMAIAWGSLVVQVNRNTSTIENSVLTVKDKTNLELQIANVLTAVNEIKADIKLLK
jgi:hypothetical protein